MAPALVGYLATREWWRRGPDPGVKRVFPEDTAALRCGSVLILWSPPREQIIEGRERLGTWPRRVVFEGPGEVDEVHGASASARADEDVVGMAAARDNDDLETVEYLASMKLALELLLEQDGVGALDEGQVGRQRPRGRQHCAIRRNVAVAGNAFGGISSGATGLGAPLPCAVAQGAQRIVSWYWR